MEMYQKTEAVRRALQHTLRRGSSLYGSMPEALLARRASAPQPQPLPLLALKQRTLQAAVSGEVGVWRGVEVWRGEEYVCPGSRPMLLHSNQQVREVSRG